MRTLSNAELTARIEDWSAVYAIQHQWLEGDAAALAQFRDMLKEREEPTGDMERERLWRIVHEALTNPHVEAQNTHVLSPFEWGRIKALILTAPPKKVTMGEIMKLITRADSVMDCDLSLADMQYLRKVISDLFRSKGVEVVCGEGKEG